MSDSDWDLFLTVSKIELGSHMSQKGNCFDVLRH